MDWRRWTLLTLVVAVGALVAAPSFTLAQEDAPPPEERDRGDGDRGDRDRRDRRWNRDPEEMRRRMMDFMRQRLGASEQEWEVIGPRLEKVATLSRQGGPAGMRALFGGRGGRPGGDERPAEELPPVTQKARALGELLREESDAGADQIAEALKADREAKAAHRQQLDQARAELREVLLVRQEAQLVLMGLLE